MNRAKFLRKPVKTWANWKGFWDRFLPVEFQDILFTQYQKCKQGHGSVADYTDEFHCLGGKKKPQWDRRTTNGKVYWRLKVSFAGKSNTAVNNLSYENNKHFWTSAVVRACKVWEPYLLQREFVVLTGHIALKQINETFDTNRMHNRWSSFLQIFEITIKHRSGVSNKVADALRRRNSLLTIFWFDVVAFNSLKQLYSTDDVFVAIWNHFLQNKQIFFW